MSHIKRNLFSNVFGQGRILWNCCPFKVSTSTRLANKSTAVTLIITMEATFQRGNSPLQMTPNNTECKYFKDILVYLGGLMILLLFFS